PSTIRNEGDARCVQPAILLVAGFEASLERMPLPGEDHVEIAIQLNAHEASGLECGERGKARPGIALCFLAAESASHAGALHDDFVTRKIEKMRNRGLNLRRMLRRRANENLAIFSALGPCCMRLEVKMLLPADLHFAGKAMRAFCKRHVTIASSNDMRLRVKAFLRDRFTETEYRLQGFVVHFHFLGRQPTNLV